MAADYSNSGGDRNDFDDIVRDSAVGWSYVDYCDGVVKDAAANDDDDAVDDAGDDTGDARRDAARKPATQHRLLRKEVRIDGRKSTRPADGQHSAVHAEMAGDSVGSEVCAMQLDCVVGGQDACCLDTLTAAVDGMMTNDDCETDAAGVMNVWSMVELRMTGRLVCVRQRWPHSGALWV